MGRSPKGDEWNQRYSRMTVCGRPGLPLPSLPACRTVPCSGITPTFKIPYFVNVCFIKHLDASLRPAATLPVCPCAILKLAEPGRLWIPCGQSHAGLPGPGTGPEVPVASDCLSSEGKWLRSVKQLSVPHQQSIPEQSPWGREYCSPGGCDDAGRAPCPPARNTARGRCCRRPLGAYSCP